MGEGMLHIHDVEGPKMIESMETRLEAMEQQVFKCQGMVERGLNTNHMMITEFTNKNRIDANDIGKHLSRIYDTIDQLQAQIYDLQNQNSLVKSSVDDDDIPDDLWNVVSVLPDFDKEHLAHYYAHLVDNPKAARAFMKLTQINKSVQVSRYVKNF
ncbi:putative nuclease HARBI1 [Hordeum vulgare]|nr:putative nuclease HARBI1 [Hordeum vulgare]